MPVGRREVFRGTTVRVQSGWKEMIALAQSAAFARVASKGTVLGATRSQTRRVLVSACLRICGGGLETVRKFIVADIRFSLDRRARGEIAYSAAEVPFHLSRSHTESALAFPPAVTENHHARLHRHRIRRAAILRSPA
jgi:hypothetical protein